MGVTTVCHISCGLLHSTYFKDLRFDLVKGRTRQKNNNLHAEVVLEKKKFDQEKECRDWHDCHGEQTYLNRALAFSRHF